MINIDEEPYRVAPFLKKNPLSVTILLSDGQVERRYGVEGIPFTLILDRSGMIRYRVKGSGKALEDVLRSTIESLLKEGEKTTSSTGASERQGR